MITSGSNSGDQYRTSEANSAPANGAPEDGGKSRSHAGGQKDAPLRRPHVEHIGQQRTEAGPDLRDRPFAASRAAGADRQRAGNDFDERHPRRMRSLLMVIGLGDGVGPVPFGLGSKRIHDPAAEQTADRGHEQQQPGAERFADWRQPAHFEFAGRADRRLIADDHAQRVVLDDARGDIEPDRADARDESDQNRRRHEPQLGREAAWAAGRRNSGNQRQGFRCGDSQPEDSMESGAGSSIAGAPCFRQLPAGDRHSPRVDRGRAGIAANHSRPRSPRSDGRSGAGTALGESIARSPRSAP